MALTSIEVTIYAAVFLVIYAFFRSTKALRSRHPQPPGPPGFPIIGNLLDLPSGAAWPVYRQWSDTYNSDLVRLNVLGNNIIIVNTLAAATALLEKRSSNYSDRPEMPMLGDLCGFDWALAFRRYGSGWNQSRRAFQQNFHAEGVKRFRPILEGATHEFLGKLERDPVNLMSHLRHLAGAEILQIAYGIKIAPENDPWVEIAEIAVEAISAATNAGSYLVDAFPILKHLPSWCPGAGFKKQASHWRHYVMKTRDAPFEDVKRRMALGEVPDCVVSNLLRELDANEHRATYTEDSIKSAAGSMYAGGADTTVSALGTFFLAMVLHPEYQDQAQAQIDKICQGRLPDFSDRAFLPYIDALVKESLRWNNVVPLNVPHRASSDDVYNEYLIPKDSIVVANIWAILHDGEAYSDPYSFNPTRFLKDGQLDPDVRDPTVAAFGFGRRICPGRLMAYESMWIAIATSLALFRISKAEDHGAPIIPATDYFEGFLCYPKPFPCNIRLRSAGHRSFLEAVVLAA